MTQKVPLANRVRNAVGIMLRTDAWPFVEELRDADLEVTRAGVENITSGLHLGVELGVAAMKARLSATPYVASDGNWGLYLDRIATEVGTNPKI
jgi:hypothetical protein